MAINKTINKRTNSHGAMRNCIEYVLREGKTDQHLIHITGPYPYEKVNYDLVYQSFLEEKRLWGKDSGRMYAHNVISWHKDEKITPEQALEFGIAFAEKWFSGFQTVVSVHKDKDHIHCHLVTNSVSYENGKKLHNSRKDLERMKQFTNQMCRERGFTVAEKGKHFDGSQIETGEVIAWSKDKYNLFRQQAKDSFVADCAMAVLTVMEHCTNREQFIREMKSAGWIVNWTEKRKHITFQNLEGKKVRDSNLSKTFHLKISKGELEDEFIRNEQKERCGIDKDDSAEADLARYYRQVEEAVAGTGGDIGESDYREKRITESSEQGSGTDTEMYGTNTGTPGKSSEDLIRESEAARRTSEANRGKSETANRIVQNAEYQSVIAEKQRRSAEQERIIEQERARTARRKNKRRSGPEL
ncbi:MAG: relaxase/mobilization nuclease domain-containing protein [Muricoprocola sp.]